MNSIEDLLRELTAVQGDTQAQAALTAEFMLLNQPEEQREKLREALDAAAVLRWFNAELLAKVLDISEADTVQRFQFLKSLSFVEVYRSGKDELYNVHESTRLGWRKKLFKEHLQHFRDLSLRVSACFTTDNTAAGRIEWIYHLLCANPDQGATELRDIDRAWAYNHPEHKYALASALQELEETRLVANRTRCWVLLVIAWTRESRDETAQLSSIANEILILSLENNDQVAEADAQCLLGSISQTKGKLNEALTAYNETLAILHRLVEQDPSNASWQQDLAVAYNRTGSVFQTQGKLNEALTAYSEFLAILHRLVEQDPSNASWQRELAVAYSNTGSVFQAQGKLNEGLTAYSETLAILYRLVEQDPSNASWQRGLAISHINVGSILHKETKFDKAQLAFKEAEEIMLRLTALDPSNAVWQQDLENVHSWLQ
jgi:tetratricopeptide (TPR) repeat protein